MSCGYCGRRVDEPHRMHCPGQRGQPSPTLPVLGFCEQCAKPLVDASVCHFCGKIQLVRDER